MAQYAFGQVVVIDFAYTDNSGSKRRPALVLFDDGYEDVLACPITSNLSAAEITLLND